MTLDVVKPRRLYASHSEQQLDNLPRKTRPGKRIDIMSFQGNYVQPIHQAETNQPVGRDIGRKYYHSNGTARITSFDKRHGGDSVFLRQNNNINNNSIGAGNTSMNFLQRLLDIEKRHDEKKGLQRPRPTNLPPSRDANDMRDVVPSYPGMDFTRSPTRWLSEQIFDDSADTNSYQGDEISEGEEDNPIFYKSPSPTGRLSSVSSLSQSSPIASYYNKDMGCSLPFIDQHSQHDDSKNSHPNFSYVKRQQPSDSQRRKRPLRLPPIFLPPIYAVRPRPLKERDFLTPTHIRGPITDDEWQDLRQCRYIRPAPPRYQITGASSELSLL